MEKQFQADAVRDGDKQNIVLYFARGTHYNKMRANLKLTLTSSKTARVLTLSKAKGVDFEVLPQRIAVPANATTFSHTLEIEPGVAWSLTIQ